MFMLVEHKKDEKLVFSKFYSNSRCWHGLVKVIKLMVRRSNRFTQASRYTETFNGITERVYLLSSENEKVVVTIWKWGR